MYPSCLSVQVATYVILSFLSDFNTWYKMKNRFFLSDAQYIHTPVCCLVWFTRRRSIIFVNCHPDNLKSNIPNDRDVAVTSLILTSSLIMHCSISDLANYLLWGVWIFHEMPITTAVRGSVWYDINHLNVPDQYGWILAQCPERPDGMLPSDGASI